MRIVAKDKARRTETSANRTQPAPTLLSSATTGSKRWVTTVPSAKQPIAQAHHIAASKQKLAARKLRQVTPEPQRKLNRDAHRHDHFDQKQQVVGVAVVTTWKEQSRRHSHQQHARRILDKIVPIGNQRTHMEPPARCHQKGAWFRPETVAATTLRSERSSRSTVCQAERWRMRRRMSLASLEVRAPNGPHRSQSASARLPIEAGSAFSVRSEPHHLARPASKAATPTSRNEATAYCDEPTARAAFPWIESPLAWSLLDPPVIPLSQQLVKYPCQRRESGKHKRRSPTDQQQVAAQQDRRTPRDGSLQMHRRVRARSCGSKAAQAEASPSVICSVATTETARERST